MSRCPETFAAQSTLIFSAFMAVSALQHGLQHVVHGRH